MLKPPIPPDETARLATLKNLGILYTPAEERYDRITRLASRLLGTPIALVSLVAERTKWFKSAQGLDAAETSREVSFCGHAILGSDTLVVNDATHDERFADNPLVTGSPDIRFYAGHPIHAADGMPIGTLCVIDRKPHEFEESDRATLRDLAALVEAELQREELTDSQRKWLVERDELLEKSSVDSLTHAWNRGAIMELLAGEVTRAERGTPLSVAMVDIDHFKNVNDTYGHQTGDAVLTEVASRLASAVRDFDRIGRYGGEEFLVVLSNCGDGEADTVCERMRAKIAGEPIQARDGTAVAVTASIGVTTFRSGIASGDELIAAADQALYAAKDSGRNRVVRGPARP